MRFLVDTHTLLWYLNDNPELSATARQHIDDPVNDILVSIGSLWEIAIKTSLGKLSLPAKFDEFIPEQMIVNEFDLFPISLEHLASIVSLPYHHRDPFDRLLAAQSLSENIPLITRDPAFIQYNVVVIW